MQRERIHERCKAICPNKDGVEAVSSITQNNGMHNLILVLVAMAATLSDTGITPLKLITQPSTP